MKLALIADIHGNLAALEAVAADIRRRGADLVLSLGDQLSGPLMPLETAQFLIAEGWVCLAGNHERQLLTQSEAEMGASDAYTWSCLTSTEVDWLRSLPADHEPAADVFLCHGTPRSDSEYFLETLTNQGSVRAASSDEVEERLAGQAHSLVACGHTHIARSLRASGNRWVVNPGSVGLPAYDSAEPWPHVLESGSPDARYALVERVKNGWCSSLISVPYDPVPMAQLAKERGRPEWYRALLTGYVS